MLSFLRLPAGCYATLTPQVRTSEKPLRPRRDKGHQPVVFKVTDPLCERVGQVGRLRADGFNEGEHLLGVQADGRLVQVDRPRGRQRLDGGAQVLQGHPCCCLGRGRDGLIDEAHAQMAVQRVKDLVLAGGLAYKVIAAGRENDLAI